MKASPSPRLSPPPENLGRGRMLRAGVSCFSQLSEGMALVQECTCRLYSGYNKVPVLQTLSALRLHGHALPSLHLRFVLAPQPVPHLVRLGNRFRARHFRPSELELGSDCRQRSHHRGLPGLPHFVRLRADLRDGPPRTGGEFAFDIVLHSVGGGGECEAVVRE